MTWPPTDLLGAHVSTLGGVALAPGRGMAIGATAMQVFTKTPNQWREPVLREADVVAFRAALAGSGIRAVVTHDSYLINLASPDDALRAKSIRAFTGELQRTAALGIPWVVSHPGNYIDDRAAGLDRNARGYAECLGAVPGDVGVLIEGTAGAARPWEARSRSCARSATPFPRGCRRGSGSASTRRICTPRGMRSPMPSKRSWSGSIGRSDSTGSSACTSTTPRVRPGHAWTATSGSAKARSDPRHSGGSCGTCAWRT